MKQLPPISVSTQKPPVAIRIGIPALIFSLQDCAIWNTLLPDSMLISLMAFAATAAANLVSSPPPRVSGKVPTISAFEMKAFLDSVGMGRNARKFRGKETVFTQGDSALTVMFIREGGVKLTVVSESGREAVVALVGPGDFFGEECLTGPPKRFTTATTIVPTTVFFIPKNEMSRMLRGEHEFSGRFIAYMLARNIRIEQDLVDQLFNSSEKRLARALLLLAGYDTPGPKQNVLPKISQETLADMIGTTRPRVNFFMNKFRRLGFIEYRRRIQVNDSLLTVVLHD